MVLQTKVGVKKIASMDYDVLVWGLIAKAKSFGSQFGAARHILP